jgi:hypothetical protein
MRALVLKAIPAIAFMAILTSCAHTPGSLGSESHVELEGKVISRTFASMQPGKLRREPGLSSWDKAIAPQVERSALPVPTYEHKVEVAPGRVVAAIGETDAFSVGTCVRILEYSSGKAARVVAVVPCTLQRSSSQ